MGEIRTHVRANGCGAATPQSTSRDTEIGGSHMSRKYSTAIGLAAGAACAGFIGMGAAHADTPVIDPLSSPDPYVVLFGAGPTQLAGNELLDTNAATADPTNYAIFNNDVSAFEASPF